MILNLIVFILIMFILMIMLLVNFMISKKMFKNREKCSPFECGFDPVSSSRKPFSLQFYLISIIFLIFDVEIALILPSIEIQQYFMYFLNETIIIILMILLFGLYVEWKEGALKWFK
uniref:NADH-ubiquinone oxidoreductase chain 3 n=1 Tax=Podagrion sp. JY-2018 TaxID=2109700 RepID=A0A2R4FZQ2_9HYME|nr:NADH dehydrogenase subunit 3 [Podagrion sp. JY-2018]